MSLPRRLILALSGFFLRFALFGGFTALALVILLGSGSKIKQTLIDTDAYNRFVQSVIDSNAGNVQSDSSLPLDNPAIQKIIKDSIPTTRIQSATEGVIDSTYSWLDGKTPQLSFSLDFTQDKAKLADNLSTYAITRIQTLPECTSVPEQTNIFKIPCQPYGVNFAQQQQVLKEAFNRDSNLLPDTTLSPENLPKNQQGQTIAQVYNNAPQYFRWFKRLPLIMASVVLVLSVLIIYLNRSKRIGWRYLGTSFLGSGIALLVTPLIYSFLLPHFQNSIQGGFQKPSGIEALTNDIVTHFYQDFNRLLINIGIYSIVAGVVILIVLRYTRPDTPYSQVEPKAGLSNGYESSDGPKTDQKTHGQAPIQSSEDRYRSRNPSKTTNKYRKIRFKL